MIPITADDVKGALERDLTADETGTLPYRAQKASDLVEGYLGLEYADGTTIPAVVTRVTAGAVARLYQRDTSVGSVPSFIDTRSSAMGPFNANIKYSDQVTSGDPWLTKADKVKLTNIFSGYQTSGMQSDRANCPVDDDCDDS